MDFFQTYSVSLLALNMHYSTNISSKYVLIIKAIGFSSPTELYLL